MKKHKSKIGGQALIEGIMMRGLSKASIAVREPSGNIFTETWAITNIANPKLHRKIPVIRGVFNFVETMALGYKCLMKSAEIAIPDEEEFGDRDKADGDAVTEESVDRDKEDGVTEESGDRDKANGDEGSGFWFKLLMIVSMVAGVALAIGLFMYLPSLAVKGIYSLFDIDNIYRSPIEGVIKITMFVSYMALVSLMKDIKRVFQYHGAEHKAIFCYESGKELTTENIRSYSRFHPRCGTSFLLIVIVLNILVFSVVSWESLLIRTLLKLALLPLIVGVSYELIKFAGRHDNILTRIISAPGLFLQRITTREPDDKQIEVAIAALTPVMPVNKDEDKW
ncbi:MAG: DUF1385 domain-containing protein [Oscillospiraceae bacterium]|nr:DUF1385 domain-containing protein [Oscillospiraceae bacterium]